MVGQSSKLLSWRGVGVYKKNYTGVVGIAWDVMRILGGERVEKREENADSGGSEREKC